MNEGLKSVTVLLLAPRDLVARERLRHSVSRALLASGASDINGFGISRGMELADVHTSLVKMIRTAIQNRADIWVPNPEENWCRTNQEALFLVLTLGQVLGVRVHLGLGFEAAERHSAVRGSTRRVSSILRAMDCLREITVSLAADSLLAESLKECVTDMSRKENAKSLGLSVEAALLRGIGLSDEDIVNFINTIILATNGQPIGLRVLHGLESSNHKPYTA